MGQKRLPPRLYLKTGKGRPSTWVIRDGLTRISTTFQEPDLEKAQEVLDAYADAMGVPGGPPSVPQLMARTGWVYFISCNYQYFPIKIGWASNVKTRMSSLQCALPYQVVLLAAFRGSIDDERRLHIGFNTDRLKGEWFSRSPELMNLVERCKIKEVA